MIMNDEPLKTARESLRIAATRLEAITADIDYILQHHQAMEESLILLADGQRDHDTRISRLERVLPDLEQRAIVSDDARRLYRERMSQMTQRTAEATAELERAQAMIRQLMAGQNDD